MESAALRRTLVLLVWAVTTSTAFGSEQLRLTEGSTDWDGRLELLYKAEWSPLCGLSAGQPEAEVACRQLGFLRADGDPRIVDRGPGAIVLDNLNCNGDEASILDCYHDPLGWSTCGRKSALAITCSNTSVEPTTLIPEIAPIVNHGKFRLVGGPSPYQGRVEIYLYAASAWLPLCGEGWDFDQAEAVCRRLDYRPATAAGRGRYGPGSGQSALCQPEVFVGDVRMSPFGEELCSVVNESALVPACAHAESPDVDCSGLEPGKEGRIRLSGGANFREGRVEIFERNLWKGICSDAWGLPEAQVACRQLGLPPPPAPLPVAGAFGAAPPEGALLQARPDCKGGEHSLVTCPRVDGVCTVGDAAIRCGTPAEAQELDLRLVDGRTSWEGRVEILQGGAWRSVCQAYWVWLPEADVACRQLGFLAAERLAAFGPGEGAVDLLGLNCNGDEARLVDCYHWGLRNNSCSREKWLGVVCTNVVEEGVAPTQSPDPWDRAGQVRLVGGPDPYQGRVEVYIHASSLWAPVCGAEWGADQAEEVCRLLEYRPATASGTGRYGAGAGPAAVCPVDFDPRDCALVNASTGVSCSQAADAYTVCSGKEPGSNGDMRLVNGTEPTEGRLEIYEHNAWRTLCADDFGPTQARLVCQRFNMPVPDEEAVPGGTFGTSDVHPLLEEALACTGDERLLLNCPRVPRLAPCSGGQAAFRCGTWKDAQEGDLRLVGGTAGHEGEVEVYHAGRWGRVCRQFWDEDDARVVCRQLGFLDASTLYSNARGGRWGTAPLLKDLHCAGTEDSLLECGPSLAPTTCDFYADVWCDPRPVAKYYELRLSDGPHPNQGRVEALYNGSWGTICDDDWDLQDAQVVCRQLGFSSAVVALQGSESGGLYGQGSGTILLYQLACTGDEASLVKCRYNAIYADLCDHSEDVGVVCYSDQYPSEDPRPKDTEDKDSGNGGGLSGSQIRNIILGTLVGLKLVLFISWCGYKRYKKSQEPTIVTLPPGQPLSADSPIQPTSNQDLPPSYDDATKDSSGLPDASSPMLASAPPPSYPGPEDKNVATAV